MKNKRLLGKLGLMLTAIIWGTGFTFSALALQHFTTMQVLAMRFTIAFIALLIMNFHKLKQIQRHHFIQGAIIGAILFFSYILQTLGLEYTTTSKNSFLSAIYVVLVPFISWLFSREAVSKNDVLGAFVSLIGIQLTTYSGSGLGGELGFNIGDVMTLISAVLFAGHIFCIYRYGKGMAAWMLMLLQMGSAALFAWITAFFLGQAQFEMNQEGLLIVLYIGIFVTLVSYGIQTLSQRYATSSESAVILSTESFFGLISAVLILGEPLLWNMIVGGVVIFAGILIVELKPLGEKKKSESEKIESMDAESNDIS